MKNIYRILGILILTAFYCLAINKVNNFPVNYDINGNSQTGKEVYFSFVSTNLFCHTSQSESSVTNHSNFPSSTFNNSFKGFWAILEATEQLFECEISQYTNISGTFLVRFRKADLIFPFHYFW